MLSSLPDPATPRVKRRPGAFWRQTFSSLKVPNYRLYFTGQSISLAGTWMQMTAQSWLVLTLTHSSTDLGLAVALQALPVSVHLPRFDLQHRLDLPPPDTQATMWIGNASTVAAHFDFNDNIACVAHGRRRFMLFPPEQVENLYVGPLEFTPQGVPISLVDAHNPDFARYPRFEQAAAAAQVAELEAGDAIFIPYMWWHSVRSLEPFNILINYWWNAVRRPEVAPFHSLLHAVIAIANLPSPQRDLWKGFFDHYVFRVHGDPAAHISPERRGLLGNVSPQQAAQFTAVLAHLLGGMQNGTLSRS